MKAQITLENILILFGIIFITLLSIVVMINILHLSPSSTSVPIHLVSLNVNETKTIVFMSSAIQYPQTLSIEYQKVGSSNVLTFSFSNCNIIENKSNNIFGEYIYNSTSSCNFNIFQGSYELLYAYYLNNGVKTSIKIDNKIFGFNPQNKPYYTKLIISPEVVNYNGVVSVSVMTNLTNSKYSLKVNNYPVSSCQNINSLNGCKFIVNSSLGIYTNGTYNVSATIYNNSFSNTNNNYFIVN